MHLFYFLQAAVKADATNSALDFIFTPLSAIQPLVGAIKGILAAELAACVAALSGFARLAGDAVAGVPALLATSASIAAIIVKAPAAVATDLLAGCVAAVAALQGVTILAVPALAGNKKLQVGCCSAVTSNKPPKARMLVLLAVSQVACSSCVWAEASSSVPS